LRLDASILGQAERLVLEHFDIAGDELLVGGVPVTELDRLYGTPLFVYDQTTIERRIAQTMSMLPDNFRLSYSIRANSNASILKCFANADCGLEVASEGELVQAMNAGCQAQHIVFSGQGKTRSELAVAVREGIKQIHIDSLDEARCLNDLCNGTGDAVSVTLRINPIGDSGATAVAEAGASPFGIDEEELPATLEQLARLEHVVVSGVRVAAGRRILDVDELIAHYRRAIALAQRVARSIDRPLDTVDFGGGWGTPYCSQEMPLDVETLQTGLQQISLAMKRDPMLARAEAILVPGRYLVGEAGIYLTTVTRIKRSRGRTFAITDGGMHDQIGRFMHHGRRRRRNHPLVLANKMGLRKTERLDIVGPLCSPFDILASQVAMPAPEAGDLVAVLQCGALARSLSPHGALSLSAPAEVMACRSRTRLIRRRGLPADHLRDQPDAFSFDDSSILRTLMG
jgi:diaminopimelate decarboxylase